MDAGAVLDGWVVLRVRNSASVLAVLVILIMKGTEVRQFHKLILVFRSVILLLLLIARSKLVLDFALTLHFIHLIITSLYTRSLPSNWLWWALQAASAGLMVFGGVWSCRWRELRPISFGTGDPGGGGSKPRGGGGEYEMVAREEEEAA